MADLLVSVGADISDYNNAMQSMGSTASTASNAVVNSLNSQQKSIEQLTIRMASYQRIAYTATDPARIAEYNQKVEELNAEIQRMSNLGRQGFNNLSTGAQSASMRFMQMRSGISAARDGVMAFTLGGQAAERSLMAMGHHINSLVNETGSFSGAMKALGSSLIGPGGIILALTVAAELISKFAKSEDDAYDATKHFEDAAGAQHAVVQKLDDSYGEAVKNVAELTENVKLAKEGFISKSEVVKEYNDTLGKTMGSVKTLDEVEQKLVSGGAAYVKMMLYKAAAQTALKEASDKAVEASKTQMKSDEESLTVWDKFVRALSSSGSGGAGGAGAIGAGAKAQKDASKTAQENRDKEKAQFEKDGSELLKIADDFQTKAAQISSKNKWDFFPDDKKQKIKEAVTGIDLLRQKLQEAQNALQDSIVEGKTDASTTDNPLVKNIQTLQTALDKAIATYNILLGLAGRNAPIETNTGLGSQRGFGQGLDNGGLLDNSGVRQFSPDQLDNAGLGKSNDDVVKSMQKGVKAFQDQTEWAYQAQLALKHYNEEMKAVNNIVQVFGGGLTRAFESALNGTQSFVSAMGAFLLQLIEKLVAAAAAAAVLDVLLTATGFGGAVSFGSLFGQLSGFKNLFGGTSGGSSSFSPNTFATGGIFTQPTLGIFGERGPEAIVTPEHLADFAGVNTNGNKSDADYGRKIIGVFKGSDFQLLSVRSAKTKSRTQ